MVDKTEEKHEEEAKNVKTGCFFSFAKENKDLHFINL